jgi:hypothetical protein
MNLKTNNMKYIKVQSEEIIFSHENDRYILIKKENDKIIGLNFMQGDEFDHFVEHYSYIDEDLTRFYQVVSEFINLDNEYDLINEVIWAWFRYKNEY